MMISYNQNREIKLVSDFGTAPTFLWMHFSATRTTIRLKMRSPAKSSPLRSVSSRESLHSPPNSPGTRTNFRSHTEFHRFPLSGTADELLVTYTNDVRVANQWIQDFVLVLVEEQKQKQKFPWIPVGFDLEWKPTFRAGEASNKVSLMQLAVPGNRVLLFQLRGFSHSPRSHWACSAQRLGFDGKALGHVLRAQGPFLKVNHGAHTQLSIS